VAAAAAVQALGCAHILHGQRVHLCPAAAPQWPLRWGALVRMILDHPPSAALVIDVAGVNGDQHLTRALLEFPQSGPKGDLLPWGRGASLR